MTLWEMWSPDSQKPLGFVRLFMEDGVLSLRRTRTHTPALLWKRIPLYCDITAVTGCDFTYRTEYPVGSGMPALIKAPQENVQSALAAEKRMGTFGHLVEGG